LESLLPKAGLGKNAKLQKSWTSKKDEKEVQEQQTTTTSGGGSRKGHPVLDSTLQQGGRIVDSHKVNSSSFLKGDNKLKLKYLWSQTARGTYAIHVETSDGTRHAFSSVSAENLQGVPGFKEE
jgi:hypothetical protein